MPIIHRVFHGAGSSHSQGRIGADRAHKHSATGIRDISRRYGQGRDNFAGYDPGALQLPPAPIPPAGGTTVYSQTAI